MESLVDTTQGLETGWPTLQAMSNSQTFFPDCLWCSYPCCWLFTSCNAHYCRCYQYITNVSAYSTEMFTTI